MCDDVFEKCSLNYKNYKGVKMVVKWRNTVLHLIFKKKKRQQQLL